MSEHKPRPKDVAEKTTKESRSRSRSPWRARSEELMLLLARSAVTRTASG